jgi:hypothetical protein
VIQLRMLIGLLGLDPSADTTPEIYKIVTQAQNDDAEEWARVIAGLTQGIMFQDKDADSRESCRGDEAKKLLSKTCTEVCEQIEQEILVDGDGDGDDDDLCPDLNACFAPYRYSLIPKHLLEPIIPECCGGRNPHFQVNREARILLMDDKLEAQRAKEETKLQTVAINKPANGAGAASSSSNDPSNRTDLPPGFRRLEAAKKKKTATSTTNMFMPTKKPAASFTRPGGGSIRKPGGGAAQSSLSAKTLLRPRKGTAQSLVKNSSVKNRIMGGAANKPDGEKPTGGRAMSLQRSKMKMIDVQEVEGLNKEHQKREQDQTNSRLSKKRRILENAKKRGLVSKKVLVKQDAPPPQAAAPPAAAEAPPAPEPQQQQQQAPPPVVTGVGAVGAPQQQQQQQQQQHPPQEEWKLLLQERSNKLAPEDRVRVQQFFEAHLNPTPEQPVYKMKLHEQRTADPTTGQAIKETFYLELDYSTFTSKQSKKVKRY